MMLNLEEVDWWTFDLVREAMVEAVDLWRRSPGDGRSPYAKDGPWHLMLKEAAAGDYDARGGYDQAVEVIVRPRPLSRSEVGQRDRVSEWLRFVPQPQDRRLVVVACNFYARGYKQVPWRKVKASMGIDRGEFGLRKRFERAVLAIASALNGRIAHVEAVKV